MIFVHFSYPKPQHVELVEVVKLLASLCDSTSCVSKRSCGNLPQRTTHNRQPKILSGQQLSKFDLRQSARRNNFRSLKLLIA